MNFKMKFLMVIFLIPLIGNSATVMNSTDPNSVENTQNSAIDQNIKTADKTPIYEDKELFLTSDMTKLRTAKEMVDHLSKDSKLRRLEVKDIVVVQGNYRTYPAPFNKIVDEYLVNALSKNRTIRVHHFDRIPRLSIKGSPTSLKIKRATMNDLHKIADEVNADAVLSWDLFDFEDQLHLTARLIRVYDNEVLWHYQSNEKIIKQKLKINDEVTKYQIPEKPSIAFGLMFMNNINGFKRDVTTAGQTAGLEDQELKWLGGIDVSYYSNFSTMPRWNFGLNYLWLSSIGSDIDLSINHLFFTARYQLNSYTPPILDSTSGKVLLDRNYKMFMLGFGVGQAFIGSTDAEKYDETGFFSESTKPTYAFKLFVDMQFIKQIEAQFGLIYYTGSQIELRDSNSYYKDNNLNLEGVNFFMNLKYKFDLDMNFVQ